MDQEVLRIVTECYDKATGLLEENREIVERCLSLQQTEEYRRSPAFRLKQALEMELAQSGYTSRFLPAMCRLSPSYRSYREALQRADDKMRKEP